MKSTASKEDVGDTIKDLMLPCVSYNQSDLYQVLTILPVVSTSVNFILSHQNG